MRQDNVSEHSPQENLRETAAPAGAASLSGGPLAASLTLIAALHGRRVSRDSLLSGLPMENGILSPALFSRAAKRAGLASKIIKSPLERINGLLCPAVLILSGSRACVLTALDAAAEKASVIFPGEMDEGTAELSFETLRDIYTGYVIYLKPQFKFDDRAAAPKERRGHWFWETLGAERKIYRDVVIASLLSNIFAFAMPLFVMNVYNRVVPNNAVETLWVMAIGVFIMITTDFALHMARGYLTDLAASRTNTRLSADMMEQVLGMRSEARPASVGSMVNSIQGFDSVRSFISSATVFAYVDLPFSIFFIIVIAVIAWPLAVPILIGGILVLAEAVMVQRQMRELSETTNRASSLKNATMVESLVAIESVKTQNLENTVQNRWEKTVAHLEAANVKMRLLSSAVVSWTQWVNVTISIATMVIGVYLIRANAISMGSLIAAYMLSSRAMMPISRVAGLLMQYYSTSRSLSALDDIMNKETEHGDSATFLSRPDIAGGIEFKDLCFSYPEQERRALSALNFTVRPGEKVAVVGPIGSGKSTVFKLILKLFRPTEGAIFIDGTDSRQIDPAELRRAVGAGGDALLRDAARQPRNGQSIHHRPGAASGGADQRRRRHRAEPPEGLRHAGRRARRQPLQRTAAGGGYRPRRPEKSLAAAARRADLGDGLRERRTCAPQPQNIRERQDAAPRHPPHRAARPRREDHRPRRRQDRGGRPQRQNTRGPQRGLDREGVLT